MASNRNTASKTKGQKADFVPVWQRIKNGEFTHEEFIAQLDEESKDWMTTDEFHAKMAEIDERSKQHKADHEAKMAELAVLLDEAKESRKQSHEQSKELLKKLRREKSRQRRIKALERKIVSNIKFTYAQFERGEPAPFCPEHGGKATVERCLYHEDTAETSEDEQ